MSDDKWRTFLRGYFLDLNPWAERDELKRGMWQVGWEVMACVAFVGFMYWLGWCTHG